MSDMNETDLLKGALSHRTLFGVNWMGVFRLFFIIATCCFATQHVSIYSKYRDVCNKLTSAFWKHRWYFLHFPKGIHLLWRNRDFSYSVIFRRLFIPIISTWLSRDKIWFTVYLLSSKEIKQFILLPPALNLKKQRICKGSNEDCVLWEGNRSIRYILDRKNMHRW